MLSCEVDWGIFKSDEKTLGEKKTVQAFLFDVSHVGSLLLNVKG